ncbi:MAG: hypothetical protein ACO3OY_10200, partial [bacterium]
MIVSPELLDIPDSVVRLKSRRIWKSKFPQNGFGGKEEKERFECCDDLFPRLGIQLPVRIKINPLYIIDIICIFIN